MDDKLRPLDVTAWCDLGDAAEADARDSYVIGALKKEPFTISGTWNPSDNAKIDEEATLDFTVKLAEAVKTLYSNHVLRFNGQIDNLTGAFDVMRLAAEQATESLRKFEIWFPITDRRLARRIARREGMRFSKVGKQFVMRKK